MTQFTNGPHIALVLALLAVMATVPRCSVAQAPTVNSGDRVRLSIQGSSEPIVVDLLAFSADSVWFLENGDHYARPSISRRPIEVVEIHRLANSNGWTATHVAFGQFPGTPLSL